MRLQQAACFQMGQACWALLVRSHLRQRCKSVALTRQAGFRFESQRKSCARADFAPSTRPRPVACRREAAGRSRSGGEIDRRPIAAVEDVCHVAVVSSGRGGEGLTWWREQRNRSQAACSSSNAARIAPRIFSARTCSLTGRCRCLGVRQRSTGFDHVREANPSAVASGELEGLRPTRSNCTEPQR